MLVLNRRVDEQITIGDDIILTVVEIMDTQVRASAHPGASERDIRRNQTGEGP